ncbi:MAG: EamA family transporter, partial [Planctomycetota bacterium]
MAIPYFGEACALSAAIVWALALVLFKKGTAHVRPLHLNIFKNVVGMALLLATLAALAGVGLLTGTDGERFRLTGHELMVLAISGVVGVAIADTLLFYALHLMGVGLMSVVDCLYAPAVIFFSWIMLSESIGPVHILGAGFIICGVLLASRHAPPPDRTRRQVLLGVVVGIGAVIAIAFAIIYAKTVLERITA